MLTYKAKFTKSPSILARLIDSKVENPSMFIRTKEVTVAGIYQQPTSYLYRLRALQCEKSNRTVKRWVVAIAEGRHHLSRGRTNKLKAHRLLGNSISPTPWLELGVFLSEWLNKQFSPTKSIVTYQYEKFAT